jgi:hypothetical protein
VSENGILRSVYGPQRSETVGEWRKLHNEKTQNFYCSPNGIIMIKSRSMRQAGHEERMRANMNID